VEQSTRAAENKTVEKVQSVRLSIFDISVVTVTYLLSFLTVAGFPHVLMAFPLDDSWIHQVVARNLAHYGTLGFIPGVWSSGSSSLLWTLILTFKWKFLPALSPVVYSDVLNFVLFIAIGLGLLTMTRKDGLPRFSCWVFALSPALDGNFIWLGVIGMEHLLFVALSVIGILLWFQTGLRSSLLCALCMGALCLTRPEGMALPLLAVLAFRFAHRRRRDLVILVSFVAICLAASFALNRLTSHSWLPMTYAGRKWLYFGGEPISTAERLTFLVNIAFCVAHAWHFTPVDLLLAPAFLTLIAVGARAACSRRHPRLGLLCVWCLALIGMYTLFLPFKIDAMRYQPLLLALSFPLLILGAYTLFRELTQKGNLRTKHLTFLIAAPLLACVLCGLSSLWFWRSIVKDKVTLVEMSHARMGRYLVDSFPINTKVAAFDIGRIAYMRSGQIVDLGGLANKSFLHYKKTNQIITYLNNRNISYFVWPSKMDGSSDIPWILDETPKINEKLTEVVIFCVPHNIFVAGNNATYTHAPCQQLFRIRSEARPEHIR
jgi:hypothetical protein